MSKLKRYDIKKLLANPDLRRHLIVESTVVTQAREGIEVTHEEAENSYYIVTEGERAAFFGLVPFRTETGDNDGRHIEFTHALRNSVSSARFDVAVRDFESIEDSPLAYDRMGLVGALFRESPKLDPALAQAAVGLQTSDDSRFVRHHWEIPHEPENEARRHWVPFAKGGPFARFYYDIYLRVKWGEDGQEMKQWAGSLYDNSHWSRIIKNTDLYFKAGLTWSRRTQRGFSVRNMPGGCIFADKGPALFPSKGRSPFFLSGVLNSSLIEMLLKCLTSFGSWEVGAVKKLPVPVVSTIGEKEIHAFAERIHDAKACWDTGNEVCTRFDRPWLVQTSVIDQATSLVHAADSVLARETTLDSELGTTYAQLNRAVFRLYGVSEALRSKIEAAIGERPPEIVWPQMEGKSSEQKRMEHVFRLLSYAVKCVVEADDDGLVALQPVAQEVPMLERIRAKLAGFFPKQDPHTLEIEIVNELKKRVKGYGRAESLQDWLTHCFFDFHCDLYQQRPILWHLASSQDSEEPAFSVIAAYHRFDHDLLAKLRSVHVRDRMATLRREAAQAGKDGREDDRLQLLAALEEVESFDKKLARLQEGNHEGAEGSEMDYRILTPWKQPTERPQGWRPDVDDGVKVNIAPLARTGLLRNKSKFGAKDAED